MRPGLDSSDRGRQASVLNREFVMIPLPVFGGLSSLSPCFGKAGCFSVQFVISMPTTAVGTDSAKAFALRVNWFLVALLPRSPASHSASQPGLPVPQNLPYLA